MKLESIKLENFRCFERLSLNCSKFTLLTGANSSGKSSIIMSVLGALQTRRFPFYFSPNGSFVNMGDFGELSHNHDLNSDFRIGLDFSTGKDQKKISLDSSFSQDPESRLPKLKTLTYLSEDLSYRVRQQSDGYEAKYNYNPTNDPYSQLNGDADFIQLVDNMERMMTRQSETQKNAARSKPTESPLINDFKSLFFPQKTKGVYSFKNAQELFAARDNPFLARRITEMCSHTESFERTSNYISSFRLPPERTYYRRTKAAMKIEKFGENWIDQLVEWESSKAEEYTKLKRVCQSLEIADDIRTEHYGGGRFEVRVSPRAKSVDCSLNDVGFGVSQFMPLLVADLQLGKNSTFLMSQPEIHLHPKIQAEYVSHLVSNSKQEDKRYIIETHSEYILNRFRLLIAKGVIQPSDVAVYHLSNTQLGNARSHALRFEKDGSISNAPRNFFETYMMDTMEIALHAEA